jgi:hypothetical protein
MLIRSLLSTLSLLLVVSTASAQTISTSFDNGDFTTGSTNSVTLTEGLFSATFDGGFQEQSFHGPAYNAGPDAYFFLNGTFTGSFGRTATLSNDVGSVDFNVGVDSVSFFASRFGNGTPSFRVLGVDDTTVLTTSTITSGSNQSGSGATPFTFDSTSLGGQIGSIEFDNAGPAGNPPYLIAIDSFSATTTSAVPEPSSAMTILLAIAGLAARRRRS